MSSVRKIHVALNTSKFEQSVAFYRAFFGLEPVKLKPGYAKFDVQDPPLNFTLNEGPEQPLGALNHLGIQVDSTEAVFAAARRLKEAGLDSWEQKDTDCCYALQDKVWVQDPSGYPWEVFVVKVADTQPELKFEAQAKGSACCTPVTLQISAREPAACCTPASPSSAQEAAASPAPATLKISVEKPAACCAPACCSPA